MYHIDSIFRLFFDTFHPLLNMATDKTYQETIKLIEGVKSIQKYSFITHRTDDK